MLINNDKNYFKFITALNSPRVRLYKHLGGQIFGDKHNLHLCK